MFQKLKHLADICLICSISSCQTFNIDKNSGIKIRIHFFQQLLNFRSCGD